MHVNIVGKIEMTRNEKPGSAPGPVATELPSAEISMEITPMLASRAAQSGARLGVGAGNIDQMMTDSNTTLRVAHLVKYVK
jgi:5-formyltetrahydrofolate cyclo-ligase